jgi:hypothetical protein
MIFWSGSLLNAVVYGCNVKTKTLTYHLHARHLPAAPEKVIAIDTPKNHMTDRCLKKLQSEQRESRIWSCLFLWRKA